MNKVQNAVFSIFPNIDSFDSFIQQKNGLNYSESIIDWAYSKELIHENNRKSFRLFINNNRNEKDNNIFNEIESFSSFIENLPKYIKIEISAKKLIFNINDFLKNKQINLPEIKDSYITRLKQGKTNGNAQKNTLRALSLWIGYEKPEYGLLYNYENLLSLCNNNKRNKWNKIEGCRLAFGLFSRGGFIDEKTIKWLIEKIENYQDDFDKHSVGKVKSYNVTTLYIDFYKKNDEKEQFYHPITFGECVNKAISLSYKLMISWLLSEYNSSKLFLFIGLSAGKFDELDFYSHIQGILNEDIPNDPIIRMTDFTRQCVVMNDIRVLTCQTPKEKLIASGEIIKVWWLDSVWVLYWDFIPDMIKNNVLLSDEKLRNILWVSRNQNQKNQEYKEDKDNAIITFFKSKQNTLLGLEIAKTLFSRKKFIEADEIIRIILSREPKNIIARTLKISILWNKGVTSDTYSKSELYFKSLEKESEYIEEYCKNKYEDHYCEYGLGVLGHATTTIRFIKKGSLSFDKEKNKILGLLSKAESIFEKAKTLSPTGSRSIFLLLYTRTLKSLIINDNNFPCDSFNSKSYLQKNHKTFDTVINEMFSVIGWLHPNLKDPKEKLLFYEDRVYQAIKLHDDSTFLRIYTPGVIFCYAVLLWDFNPFITKQTINAVMGWLKKAKKSAEQLKGQNLCIYSATKLNGENMTVKTFLSHINKCISELTKVIEKKELPKDEFEIIDDVSFKGLKLCLLNFYD